MNSICLIVAVDFLDILCITLPVARPAFGRIILVTSTGKADDGVVELAKRYNCETHRTDSFTAGGAYFNKFRALEEAVPQDLHNRWVCFMDADILLSKNAIASLQQANQSFKRGFIYSPPRRLLLNPFDQIPDCGEWSKLPYGPPDPKSATYAGYFQLFHGEDPVVAKRPWYDVSLITASDGDTQFSRKWKKHHRKRPQFEVCHLGPDSVNWCGRVIPYADGSVPSEAARRSHDVARFLECRRHKADFR